MRELLAPAHILVSAVILIWNIAMAGQIARARSVPRTFASVTGLAGLLIAPALMAAVAASTILTGRAIVTIGWIWVATTLLFAAQSIYATTRGMVTSLIGVPIAVYDVIVAASAVTRWLITREATPAPVLLALTAAQAAALGAAMGPSSLYSPFAVQIPLLAPAFPARWRASKTVRAALALFAGAWAAVTLFELPQGSRAVKSYDRYADMRLTERPARDFVIGMRVFPDIASPPSPLAVKNDVALYDTVGAGAVHVVVDPEGATNATLDSLKKLLDPIRQVDSALVIVSLGYGEDAGAAFQLNREAYTQARLRDANKILRYLQPNVFIPVVEPYSRGTRLLGNVPVSYWKDYLARMARLRNTINRRTRIGVMASRYDDADSALYAWAAAPGSPVDVLGFTLQPSFRGAPALDARMQAADRWLRASDAPRQKPHWVFANGGFPLSHGEEAQERAVWGSLAWATSQPAVKGIVIAEAGDYHRLVGMRAANGRVRPAAFEVAKAVRGMRETQAGQ
jgi:hypothetical protein